jgi:hypothetical protein
MEKSNEQLQNELDNLKKIVFRIMDFNFPDLDANINHYDFITDEVVRRQLELDFLKMMQTPASNFNVYCQYGFFQIENLLNYYYTLRFLGKLEPEITAFFSFDDKSKYSRISKVPYSLKWTKFSQEFLQTGKVGNVNTKTINYDIQKITYVRNSSIHKNTLEIEKYEDNILEKYNNLPGGRYTNDDEKNTYFTGMSISFKRTQNFSLVKNRLLELLSVIEKEIKKYQKEE